MSISSIIKVSGHVLKRNAPAILTAFGVSGTITTAYLTGKASYKAALIIKEQESRVGYSADPKERFKERVTLVWELYIPPFTAGALTIGCVLGANHVSSKRAAAAYSVLAISEKAFEEYKEKVVEKLGERKEKEIHDEIAQARVNNNPPSVNIIGSGPVLCCELYTGRYFNSDMESLRKAQNDVNAKLLSEMYVTLSDFYYIIGLPQTSASGILGWESSKQMELSYSTVMSEDNRPCIAFEYNYIKPL